MEIALILGVALRGKWLKRWLSKGAWKTLIKFYIIYIFSRIIYNICLTI